MIPRKHFPCNLNYTLKVPREVPEPLSNLSSLFLVLIRIIVLLVSVILR